MRTSALFGALGICAASQGTMNNLTFGDGRYQYYETICGGAGAGPTWDGCSAVQTHMTNSRLTDPEVLERRYPVRVEEFRIRHGSGGAGAHRGGDGVVRCLRFLEPLTAAIVSSRSSVDSWPPVPNACPGSITSSISPVRSGRSKDEGRTTSLSPTSTASSESRHSSTQSRASTSFASPICASGVSTEARTAGIAEAGA